MSALRPAALAGVLVLATGCDALFETEVEIPRVYASVSAGGDHTCALGLDGAAFCWGRGENGELGDRRNRDSAVPVAVVGGYRYDVLSAGEHHVCALTRDGVLHCWGWNRYGQLGTGNTVGLGEPTGVAGDLRFSDVSAGAFHTCALTLEGEAYCWGENGNGQLGNGTVNGATAPVPVAGGHRFVAISSGREHTCALTEDGAAYCWGLNHLGQLGDGSLDNAWEPRPVAGGIAFAAIAAGDVHTCGIARNGAAYCWGSNGYGEAGNARIELPREPGPTVPTRVYGGDTVVGIAAGPHVTCAVTEAGVGLCWGRGTYGQIGNGQAVNVATPQPVVDTPSELAPHRLRFTSIDVGGGHACGLSTRGEIFCWGSGDFGQLGNPEYNLTTAPVRIAAGE
ncbi:MAG TPA: hypothetical protein VF158_02950 [Longimicrobiales bacterium]